MKVGDLLRASDRTYLYVDGSFPWVRIARGTLLMILEAHVPSCKFRVILSDGRVGWLLENGFVEFVE